ncbi:MAG: ABC transporter ATP-binding protein [Gammaproteobacteria bacterium]|nr:ABC transporter ATP-binding protein [Gammaproteobacteria bacterium]
MNSTAAPNPLSKFLSVFQYSKLAIDIVWNTSASLTLLMAAATIVSGVLPSLIASIGGLFVDAVAAALNPAEAEAESVRSEVLFYVLIEAGLVVLLTAAQKVNSASQSILRGLLGQKINVMILEKALTLELAHFEDAEYYDKLVRARREASSKPLALVIKTFDLVRDIILLVTIGLWLFRFSPYAVLLLCLAGVPAFMAETKFSGEAFRIHRRRSAERRMQIYLELLLTREDGVKEVKLLQLGKLFLQRYVDIFSKLYREDRNLVLRRSFWGYVLGLLASAAFYLAYGWVGFAAVAGAITLGQMTMYIAQFRLGQNAVTSSLSAINGIYEDNLYLSNLTEYLEHKVPEQTGESVSGPDPEDGIRFDKVSFTYPGNTTPALNCVSLHIRPGQSLAIVGENGSGKTTLIKLLTRLYTPTTGRIMLEGLDLNDWDINTLRSKIGVIFQDFARYQLLVGENIGIGEVAGLDNNDRIEQAARQGMADEFVRDLPEGYETQLGTWFKDGKELSGGQWQKIALSRAFMRTGADVLILDEPTAAIDARAEAEIFSHFSELTTNRISIIISHRFSTVRMADHIIVLNKAEIQEQGTHEQLLDNNGQYASLFRLQARGYQ